MKAPSLVVPKDLAAVIAASGPGKRSKVRLIIILGALALGVVAWLWWSSEVKTQNQTLAYATEAVRRGSLNLTITATGNLEPTNEVTIGSELSGTTLEVYVDTNDRVTKGQPLAKLDTTKLNQQTESSRAALNSAKAGVAQAEATLKESEAALVRQQELRRLSGGKVPSQADLETSVATAERARADIVSAQAAVSEAEAQLRINENDLAKAVIKSPIDGIVLTRSVEPGQTVAASLSAPELFVIAEKLEHMKLTVTVAEADIGRVAQGLKSTFTVDAWPDRTYSASVQKVAYGSTVTNNVVTYETDLEVANDDLSLRPGMTATADIRVAERENVLLVPAAALRFTPVVATTEVAKKSFIQSLMPMPPRRTTASRPAVTEGKLAPGTARLWVLRDGSPVALIVKTGLSDGRYTEISGDDVAEGLSIILRANTPTS